jgi:hypothetical protein
MPENTQIVKKTLKKSKKELRGWGNSPYCKSATETGAADESEASNEVAH